MGKASRLKKERAQTREETGVDVAQAEKQGRVLKTLRVVMIIGIPFLTAALVYWALYSLENETAAGTFGLGGTGIWILLLITDLGKSIPSSGRDGGASIDFGTR